MFRPGARLALVAFAVAVCTLYGFDPSGAAHAAQRIHTGQVFQSGVELVTLTITVRDSGGRLVPDLTRDDFEVYEEGARQQITQFTRARVPVSVGLVLDISDSMWGERIKEARVAVERFLGELLDPGDEAFFETFNHVPSLKAPWTLNPARVLDRLGWIKPSGATAIYDAMMAATPLFESRAHPRAAIVLISDGADTASDSSLTSVKAMLRRSDVFVYAIAIDTPNGAPINTRVNPFALRDMTDDSGGYTEVVTDATELTQAASRIADELNNQYVLAYEAQHAPDGKFHSVRVRMVNTDYRARTRRGYIAIPKLGSER